MAELTRPITLSELTRAIANARTRRGWSTKPVEAGVDHGDEAGSDDTVITQDQAKAWVAQSKANIMASLLAKQSK
jgi:methionyl-tRNA formyltransferase